MTVPPTLLARADEVKTSQVVTLLGGTAALWGRQMSVGEVSGYVAATLVFMTFYMKTMVPLRVIGICSNCAFITYGFIGGLYPVLILHAILLPLNSLRLREMLQMTKQVRAAAHRDPNMDWLKPFTSTRHVNAGKVVFHKGGRRQ